MMNRCAKITLIIEILILVSCAGVPQKTDQMNYPASFNVAMHSLATNIFAHIENDLGLFKQQARIIIDPFIDAYTQEEPEVSLKIERAIKETAKANFQDFTVERMMPGNINDSDYILSGVIRLDEFDYKKSSEKTGEGKKLYRIFATVRSSKTGQVIGNSDVWVSDLKLGDYKPQPVYKDSPFYDIVDTPEIPEKKEAKEDVDKIEQPPAESEEDYFASLKIKALLTKAGEAYNRENYDEALKIYQQIVQLPEGRTMRTYAGLYMANLRLGDIKSAGNAFEKLVAISVEKNNKLTVKFTFSVNSVKFWNDPFLVKQYKLWIKKIGEYFNQSQDCLKIVGHCSNTGSKNWNYRLSRLRAKRIQNRLRPYFPDVNKKSKAIGKGFDENIIGIGTDDERDALDRRVEFIVVDCE